MPIVEILNIVRDNVFNLNFLIKTLFLIPESLKISYSVNVTDSGYIYGTPLYAPFLQLTTYINDSIVEQINRYNYLTGFILANGLYSLSDRVSMTQDYGYGGYANTTITDPSIFKELNLGNTQPNIAGSTGLGYSGKLECILSHFNSPIPFKLLSPKSTQFIPIALCSL